MRSSKVKAFMAAMGSKNTAQIAAITLGTLGTGTMLNMLAGPGVLVKAAGVAGGIGWLLWGQHKVAQGKEKIGREILARTIAIDLAACTSEAELLEKAMAYGQEHGWTDIVQALEEMEEKGGQPSKQLLGEILKKGNKSDRTRSITMLGRLGKPKNPGLAV